MVLTAAADGSVKVFHAGRNIHPYISEATTFHRMGVPVHKISGTSSRTVSLSSESKYVSVCLTVCYHCVNSFVYQNPEELFRRGGVGSTIGW